MPKFLCHSAADAVSAHKIPLPSGAAKSGQGIDFDYIVDAASEYFRDATSDLPELREPPWLGMS